MSPAIRGRPMIISIIEEPDVIRKILVHLDLWETRNHDPPTEKYIQIKELTYTERSGFHTFRLMWKCENR